MYYAADRQRFKRRVNTFEQNFSYIFTDMHRDYICSLIRDFNVSDLTANINVLCLTN